MPTLQYRDILDVQKGIIVHQINPFVMGAGLALRIRKQYPEHYEDFKLWRQPYKGTDGEIALGQLVITTHYEPLYIVGICGQKEYGFKKKEYTRYDALDTGLKSLDYLAIKYNTKVYIPYMMGCGLAGGEWRLVLHQITKITPYAIICKLGIPSNKEKRELKFYGTLRL